MLMYYYTHTHKLHVHMNVSKITINLYIMTYICMYIHTQLNIYLESICIERGKQTRNWIELNSIYIHIYIYIYSKVVYTYSALLGKNMFAYTKTLQNILAYTYARACIWHIYSTNECICICTYIYVYMLIYTHATMCIYVYTCKYIYINKYSWDLSYICMSRYIYIYV